MQCDERRRQEEEEKTKKKKGVWKLEKLEGKGEEEGKLGVGGGPVECRVPRRQYPPRGRRKPPGGPEVPEGYDPTDSVSSGVR